MFKGNWLQVRDPVEPDLINWHNFGVRKVQRYFRTFLFLLFVVAMIFGCCIGVVYMENTVKSAEAKIPQIDCNYEVSPEKAYADFLNFNDPALVPNGEYHCFCKNIYEKDGMLKIDDVKLGDDGSCKDWFEL